MRLAAVLLSCLMAFEGLAGAQTRPSLRIIVIEGEGAIHNAARGSTKDPIVEVRDDSDRPVAGARLTFSLPDRGPSGTFFGAGRNLNVLTNEQGRGTGIGFKPNFTAGRFQIQVTASEGDRTGTARISQSNVVTNDANNLAGNNRKFWQKKIFAVVVAGAIAGAVIATHGGNESSTTAVPGTSITPGTVSVGTPR